MGNRRLTFNKKTPLVWCSYCGVRIYADNLVGRYSSGRPVPICQHCSPYVKYIQDWSRRSTEAIKERMQDLMQKLSTLKTVHRGKMPDVPFQASNRLYCYARYWWRQSAAKREERIRWVCEHLDILKVILEEKE